jgi:endonuclease/exonuclease/phosphatase (EEP) superfamily protein YafD
VKTEPVGDRQGSSGLRVTAGRVAAAVVAAVMILVGMTAAAPATTGSVALAQILLPHLVLVTLVMASGLAIMLRSRGLTVALAILVVVGCLRFGSEWVSVPAPVPAGTPVALLSWNLELGARPPGAVAGPILEHDADVVALQELTPGAAAALESDERIRARYPYSVLAPDRGAFGIGILSAFPIVDRELFSSPAGAAVTLELAPGRRLRVLNGHPMPGKIESVPSLGLPISFDATERDGALRRIRGRIETLLATAIPFVVIGDYNTAPTEPGYATLTAGLHDAHAEVGFGPGWTWRPSSLESLGVGLLRIDLVLAGPGVTPTATGVDCGKPGDHCLVHATVVVR